MDAILSRALDGITGFLYDVEDEEAADIQAMAVAAITAKPDIVVALMPPHGPDPVFTPGLLPFLSLTLMEAALGRPLPDAIDYPMFPAMDTEDFMGRWFEIAFARHLPTRSGRLFIKPYKTTKAFPGRVLVPAAELDAFLPPGTNLVWVSGVVDFRLEYRTFVVRGEVLAQVRYRVDPRGKAHPRHRYDHRVAEAHAAAYAAASAAGKAIPPAPLAYVADFGLTADGRTLLVEVGDGFSFGVYGASPKAALAVAATRWKELVKHTK